MARAKRLARAGSAFYSARWFGVLQRALVRRFTARRYSATAGDALSHPEYGLEGCPLGFLRGRNSRGIGLPDQIDLGAAFH
jgi:hypothetical protein